MKKFLSSAAFITVFTLYAIARHMGGTSPVAVQSDPSPAATTTAASNGRYRDGTYTGPVTDAYYGNVQVRVTVQSGQIADVQFLDYPSDRSTSRYINSQATPALRSEAIQSQIAPVDAVSGATYTSQAFNQSFASALAQARQA